MAESPRMCSSDQNAAPFNNHMLKGSTVGNLNSNNSANIDDIHQEDMDDSTANISPSHSVCTSTPYVSRPHAKFVDSVVSVLKMEDSGLGDTLKSSPAISDTASPALFITPSPVGSKEGLRITSTPSFLSVNGGNEDTSIHYAKHGRISSTPISQSFHNLIKQLELAEEETYSFSESPVMGSTSSCPQHRQSPELMSVEDSPLSNGVYRYAGPDWPEKDNTQDGMCRSMKRPLLGSDDSPGLSLETKSQDYGACPAVEKDAGNLSVTEETSLLQQQRKSPEFMFTEDSQPAGTNIFFASVPERPENDPRQEETCLPQTITMRGCDQSLSQTVTKLPQGSCACLIDEETDNFSGHPLMGDSSCRQQRTPPELMSIQDSQLAKGDVIFGSLTVCPEETETQNEACLPERTLITGSEERLSHIQHFKQSKDPPIFPILNVNICNFPDSPPVGSSASFHQHRQSPELMSTEESETSHPADTDRFFGSLPVCLEDEDQQDEEYQRIPSRPGDMSARSDPHPIFADEASQSVDLVMQMNRVLRKFSPAVPHNLIGRGVGLPFVDIVGELHDRNLPACGVVNWLTPYLRPMDFIRMSGVCRRWRRICLQDNVVHQFWALCWRLHSYPDEKENDSPSKDTSGSGRCHHMTRSAARLGDIQPSVPEPLRHNSCPLGLYEKVRKSLHWEESLRHCPLCHSVAKVIAGMDHAQCQNTDCLNDFCTRCLTTYHPTSACKPCCPTSKKDTPGNKKSKKQLKRIISL